MHDRGRRREPRGDTGRPFAVERRTCGADVGGRASIDARVLGMIGAREAGSGDINIGGRAAGDVEQNPRLRRPGSAGAGLLG